MSSKDIASIQVQADNHYETASILREIAGSKRTIEEYENKDESNKDKWYPSETDYKVAKAKLPILEEKYKLLSSITSDGGLKIGG